MSTGSLDDFRRPLGATLVGRLSLKSTSFGQPATRLPPPRPPLIGSVRPAAAAAAGPWPGSRSASAAASATPTRRNIKVEFDQLEDSPGDAQQQSGRAKARPVAAPANRIVC